MVSRLKQVAAKLKQTLLMTSKQLLGYKCGCKGKTGLIGCSGLIGGSWVLICGCQGKTGGC